MGGKVWFLCKMRISSRALDPRFSELTTEDVALFSADVLILHQKRAYFAGDCVRIK